VPFKQHVRRIAMILATALLVVCGTIAGLASPSAGSVGARLAVGLVVAALFAAAAAALDKLAAKRRSLLR
jgi:hypothetical protein